MPRAAVVSPAAVEETVPSVVVPAGDAPTVLPTDTTFEALGVPKAKVKILSGVTSRLKQVAIDGDPKILGETLRKATAAKPEKTKD